MYVCMYICMYASGHQLPLGYLHVNIIITYIIHMHVHAYTHLHSHVGVFIYRKYTDTHVCTYNFQFCDLFVDRVWCLQRIHTYIHTYIHKYIHTCIYTNKRHIHPYIPVHTILILVIFLSFSMKVISFWLTKFLSTLKSKTWNNSVVNTAPRSLPHGHGHTAVTVTATRSRPHGHGCQKDTARSDLTRWFYGEKQWRDFWKLDVAK